MLAASVPGDRICLSGDTGRLEINRPGTPSQPIVILGGGKANTAGMNVEADNILVDGIIATRPQAPGFLLRGKNITVQNSSVISPQGGDGDGMRFFGSNIKILHNLVRNTVGRDERHADAIQTFATGESSPASQDILIEGNRFEDIANICLIAEGPNSEAGDGSGVGNSTNIAFRDNYCQSGAGQAVLIDDVTNVKLENNEIVGTHENAFELQNNSTGARVDGNKIAEGSASKVYVDDSSMNGYQGPHE